MIKNKTDELTDKLTPHQSSLESSNGAVDKKNTTLPNVCEQRCLLLVI